VRPILILHRYLGVAVGLLMTLWCLSGFVMMYQSFPETTAEERLQGLEPLRLDGCCDPGKLDIADNEVMAGFRVEMLAGRPMLRLPRVFGPPRILDLGTGQPMGEVTADTALAVAKAFGVGREIAGPPRYLGEIEQDQWSVQAAGRHQPLHHIAFDGPAGVELYVSGTTGEVVQDTDARERLLGWLGAVPHWLYPTVLRQNGALWNQVVVWSAVVGTFLTVTGLYVGISRLRPRPGRWSPYGGIWLWHHLAGLFFGVLTLSWVASGLMTMNPWGLLESQDPGAYRRNLAGEITGADLKRFLTAANRVTGPGVVQIEAAPLAGKFYASTVGASGPLARFDLAGSPHPMAQADVARALGGVGAPVASLTRLTQEDDFYYGHHQTVRLPVYRAVLADGQDPRLYIDAVTGGTLRTVDKVSRASRWVRNGLHGMDFAGLRRRPVWDLVVLPLLAGVTLVCATGAWMGLLRIRRDFRSLRFAMRPERRRPVSG